MHCRDTNYIESIEKKTLTFHAGLGPKINFGILTIRTFRSLRFTAEGPLTRGGGGYSGNILEGVCPGTPKKEGLRCGHSPKRAVLGAGTAPKMGGLQPEKGGI